MINTNINRFAASAALAGFVALATSQSATAANEYQSQQQVFQGAHCQAMYGTTVSRITRNIDWLSNGSNYTTHVSCSLTRGSTKRATPPRARVRTYRPNGAGALDCLFYGRAVTGAAWSTAGSAVQGWSYVDMTLPNTANGASYAVRCTLPPGARIQKVVFDE